MTITLVEGARIEVTMDETPVGAGRRRYTVNEVGTRWVKLFYAPQAATFRVLREQLESNRTLQVVESNTRKLAAMIKTNAADRTRLDLPVSKSGVATALAHLKDGTAAKAKAASRELTIKAATAVDWTRVRGNGLLRTIDGKTFTIRKAGADVIGLIDDQQVATGATEDAVKRALLKAHRDAQRPAVAGTEGKSKREIVAALLLRGDGCTTQDILAATGWPAVSVPQQARASGLTLKSHKMPGQPTRYWGSRAE